MRHVLTGSAAHLLLATALVLCQSIVFGADRRTYVPPVGPGKCVGSCPGSTPSRSGGSGLGPGGTRLTAPPRSEPSSSWSPAPRSPATSGTTTYPGTYNQPYTNAPAGAPPPAAYSQPRNNAAPSQHERARREAELQRQQEQQVRSDVQQIVSGVQGGFTKTHGEGDSVKLEFAGANPPQGGGGGSLGFVNQVDTGNRSPGAQLGTIEALGSGDLSNAAASKGTLMRGFDTGTRQTHDAPVVNVSGIAPPGARQPALPAAARTPKVVEYEAGLQAASKSRAEIEQKLEAAEQRGTRNAAEVKELINLRDQLSQARNQENYYTAKLRDAADNPAAAAPASVPSPAAAPREVPPPGSKPKEVVRGAHIEE